MTFSLIRIQSMSSSNFSKKFKNSNLVIFFVKTSRFPVKNQDFEIGDFFRENDLVTKQNEINKQS